MAVALVDSGNNLVWEAAPECARELEDAIVKWGRTCIRRRMIESGENMTLDASCRAGNLARIELLQRHGFVPTGDTSLRMRRALDEPIPPAMLSPGFAIRPLDGEREVEALVELHRAAFGTEYMTIGRRLSIMHAPEYDPTMDLVAVAPDGRLAAYCTCTVHAAENERTGKREGSTDPVATHPAFQRLGLARALLLTGLALLKARGMETGWLGTSGANVGMQRAAEAAGFRVETIVLWFQTALETGQSH